MKFLNGPEFVGLKGDQELALIRFSKRYNVQPFLCVRRYIQFWQMDRGKIVTGFMGSHEVKIDAEESVKGNSTIKGFKAASAIISLFIGSYNSFDSLFIIPVKGRGFIHVF